MTSSNSSGHVTRSNDVYPATNKDQLEEEEEEEEY